MTSSIGWTSGIVSKYWRRVSDINRYQMSISMMQKVIYIQHWCCNSFSTTVKSAFSGRLYIKYAYQCDTCDVPMRSSTSTVGSKHRWSNAMYSPVIWVCSECINGRIDGYMNKWMDIWMDEWKDEWKDEWMDKKINGWMDWWMDEYIDDWRIEK